MPGKLIYRFIPFLLILSSGPFVTLGNNGGPHRQFSFVQVDITHTGTDSLPGTPPTPNEKKDQPGGPAQAEKATKPPLAGHDIIKEVPRARKQVMPVPVPNLVKPVKVIRPKIIKNTIRVIK